MKKIFSHKNKMLAGCLLMAAGILIVSCKKLIQIPANPTTSITRDEAFADSSTTIAAVAGVYTYTVSQNNNGIPYYDGVYDLTTAISGHEVGFPTSGDYATFYTYTLIPTNGEINSIWVAHYAEIYQVNDVLGGVTGNSKLSASLIKQVTGEMDVVRAYLYFNLVNMFGSIPLVTTTDYATNAQSPQVTKSVIYNQINADLNDAVKKLTAAYPTYSSGVTFGKVRPNLYTAIALQAKVHLYQSNWKAAYAEADSVIQYGTNNPTVFKMLSDPNQIFLDGSTEAIWQVPVENYQGTGDAVEYIPYGNVPNYPVTDSLVNAFEPNDLRKADWLTNTGGGPYYPFKYKDKNLTSPATDFMMLRYAEMYLIRAEAAAQLNNLSQAILDINVIRTRAGLAGTTANPTSKSAVLGAVKQERRIEMCFELGNRWFDLNRTQTDSNYPASGQASPPPPILPVLKGWQTNAQYFPIPQTQIQLNSHLTQNPGYH